MPLSAQETNLLERGVAEVIERRSLETKLHRHRPLRVKLGIDPTGYQLHLGHVVPLRKLQAFQMAGHRAILIIGDYTARVGDPSGRDKTRPALSAEQTKKFGATYLEQAGKILDLKKAEVRYNSEWLDKFTAADFLRLMMSVSANTLLTHETFRRRLDAGQPLGLHELSYPILQGYDSVAVEADIELGGIDQKFNLLTGRDVQARYGQEKQDIMLFDYLLGTDGKEKMSKTANNTIAIDDAANDMYGKTMSIPDKAMVQYFLLATDTSSEEMTVIVKELKNKKNNPRNLKARLAKNIVTLYHGEAAANAAEFEFTHIHRKKGQPSDIESIETHGGEHSILHLLINNKLATSRSEARRLVEQGGVKLDQKVITDWEAPVVVVNGAVLQVGKRKFVKLLVK